MSDIPPLTPPPPPAGAESIAPTQPPRPPDRTWDILCHLSALAGFLIPFGNIIGPLVIWLLQKDKVPGVDYHGKEALNFQISMTIYLIVSAISLLVMIGFVLLPALLITSLVLTIIAAIKASNGESYRYPFTIRLIH